MGTEGAQIMIQGIAFGVFALSLLIMFALIARVMKHQHCCDGLDKNKRTCKQKLRASAEEMSNFGVLPTTILVLCLWVPISLQRTILEPCWECFDFEAAAVHEIGHILGLNHPDAVIHANGSNVYGNYAASNDGMNPYDSNGFPSDICMNPWQYVENGVYPAANDKNPDTGVRQSIMYSLTEHNPQVCLTPDDLEGIYTIYPRCDGRGISQLGASELNCYKTKPYIGAVRVLVYIFTPVLAFLLLQIMVLSCIKHHHDMVVKELAKDKTKAIEIARKHKKVSIEMEKKNFEMQQTLQTQLETEDERVEERAQEMAAQMIQAKLRGNLARRASSVRFGEDVAQKMASTGTSKQMSKQISKQISSVDNV